MNEPQPAPAFITAGAVADILQISTMSVYRLVERGELAAFRFGNSLRFDPDDVDRWIADQRVRPAPPARGKFPETRAS